MTSRKSSIAYSIGIGARNGDDAQNQSHQDGKAGCKVHCVKEVRRCWDEEAECSKRSQGSQPLYQSTVRTPNTRKSNEGVV